MMAGVASINAKHMSSRLAPAFNPSRPLLVRGDEPSGAGGFAAVYLINENSVL